MDCSDYKDSPTESAMVYIDGFNLGILRKIVDNDGDWFTWEARSEFLSILGRVIANRYLSTTTDGYDSVANGMIFSYWKMENSTRMMTEPVPALNAYSMEYIWDMLRRVNLGELIVPFEFQQYFSLNNGG